MSTFSSTLQLLYLLSSQMFMLHSKCGSRLTSSVAGTARRFPHLQQTMYCAVWLPAPLLSLLAACGSGLGGSESGSESETVGMA